MNSITITEEAAEQAKKILNEENAKALRIFLTGGGCAGFQYGFNFVFEGENNENDFTFEQHGLTVVIDNISFEYLNGSELGWKKSLEGSYFVFKNPNATRSCGCNKSFTVD